MGCVYIEQVQEVVDGVLLAECDVVEWVDVANRSVAAKNNVVDALVHVVVQVEPLRSASGASADRTRWWTVAAVAPSKNTASLTLAL